MNQERTDAQIFAHRFNLQFGDKTYEAQVLTVGLAANWRKILIETGREIMAKVIGKTTNGTDDNFFVGLATVFLGFPEKMVDLVFAYAVDLPREEILAIATDEEIAIAFSQIFGIAFPYKGQLSLMSSVLQMGASLSASARSTN